MLTACWSVKGGSGTTVVAATLALAATRRERGAIVADLAGDQPAALGLSDPHGPGLGDWLAAGTGVPDDALSRIAVLVSPSLRVIPLGDRGTPDAWSDAAGSRLADALRALGGAEADVVVDCGRADSAAATAVVEASDRSLLVLRPCYLALRRAAGAPRPTGVVLVTEPERSLGVADIEDVLGVPVVADIAWDPAVARAVDSGLIATRLPRRLLNALREVPV